MGTIRMIVLDGLTVGDLLALRQGAFFEGAEVRLPSAASTTPVPVSAAVATPTTTPVVAAPRVEVVPPAAVVAPVVAATPVPAEEPRRLTAKEEALLAQAHAEAEAYMAERAAAAAQDARSAAPSGIDPTPAPIVAPDAPAAVNGGLPSVAQLSACTKLRDVLQLLVDGGLAADQLTPYLESVRDQIPLLQRIANIPERVARTLSVMQGQG